MASWARKGSQSRWEKAARREGGPGGPWDPHVRGWGVDEQGPSAEEAGSGREVGGPGRGLKVSSDAGTPAQNPSPPLALRVPPVQQLPAYHAGALAAAVMALGPLPCPS